MQYVISLSARTFNNHMFFHLICDPFVPGIQGVNKLCSLITKLEAEKGLGLVLYHTVVLLGAVHSDCSD